MFACCLKLPVCKLVCFRCILPSCYGCAESDDEAGEANDEGYHSNRRSSEILPQAEGGTERTSDRQEVEMSEIKSETVNLIPPPRPNVNDYRRDSPRREQRGAVGGARENTDDTEVTYIEVESVSLSDLDISNKRIPNSSDSGNTSVKLAMDYEEPIQSNILEEQLVVSFEKALAARGYGGESPNQDTDVSDDSESQYYVNEDVLKPKNDPMQTPDPDETDSSLVKQYMNLDNVPTGSVTGSKESVSNEGGKPHEYVNMKAPGDADVANETSASSERLTESPSKGENLTEFAVKLTVQLPSRKSKKTKDETDKKQDVKSDLDVMKLSDVGTKEKKASKGTPDKKKTETKTSDGRKDGLEKKSTKHKESKVKATEKVDDKSKSVKKNAKSDEAERKESKHSSSKQKMKEEENGSDVCVKDNEKLILVVKEADDKKSESSDSPGSDLESEQTTDQTKLI